MGSLATRCSACGTVFRVTPEQLRVSEGWVRCGRCAQVFNAQDRLVDPETGMPRRDLASHPVGSHSGSAPLDAAQPARESSANRAATAQPPQAAQRPPSPPVDAFRRSDTGGPRAASPQLAPSFVRQAERAARWRRPGVRAALASTALLAATLLAAQVAHTWRDQLAGRVPTLAPVLAQGCAWLGCELGPARGLDALSVESSGLVRVELSNLYELQVSLRNRADHPVALPALDLSLNGPGGELLARRVLQPAELGARAATIEPGREILLQATLQSGASADGASLVITGYTVEMFYP